MQTLKQALKDSLQAAINKHRCNDSIALAFSGGTDSLAILFALLEMGKTPALYTYYIEGIDSQDLQVAAKVAEFYRLELYKVPVPSATDALVRDVKRIVALAQCAGKVTIQCLHGHFYLAPAIKEHLVFDGTNADTLYGSFKSHAMAGCKSNREVFDRMRHKGLAALTRGDNYSVLQRRLYLITKHTLIHPYQTMGVIEAFMARSWIELNTPFLKYAMVKDFKQFDEIDCYRTRGSQQIVAGTRAMHEKLLTLYNPKQRKRVNEIYKDILQQNKMSGGLIW